MPNLIIVWFRNDLRLHDNETLHEALQNATHVLPVYCFDTRQFGTTAFGFPKTGAIRAKFLLETVRDLKLNLQDIGSDLVIKIGKPEEIVFALAKHHKAKAVYCQQEATDEEMLVEEQLERNLDTIGVGLKYFWGHTLYHYDDLPFEIDQLPDIFTTFRKQIEEKCTVRATFPTPQQVPIVNGIQAGSLPTLPELGLTPPATDPRTHTHFKGGETQALLRLKHYLWETNLIVHYKETRNGLLGTDYSSKFSAWLANGSLSPRQIYHSIKQYETEQTANESTYWLVFELIWRDYFRYVAMKYGNDIFKQSGIMQRPTPKNTDTTAFEHWKNGTTGIPFIDANMRELLHSGYMSNRGRQNVGSFLVKDMQLNWLLGAQWFESQLIDYDVCSNYGNWQYLAGIGNDPRPDRYFNIIKQAYQYDPQGTYVKHWCPELQQLPSARIHEPYKLTDAEQKYLRLNIGKDYPKPCVDTQKWKVKK